MSNFRHLTPEERRQWRHFTQDVECLHPRVPEPYLPREKSLPPASPMPVKPAMAAMPTILDELRAGDLSALDKRTAQRLKRGHHRPEATLDLHGMNQQQAYDAFQQFLHLASHEGLRVLRVITGYGKMSGGQAVLKNALPRWINFTENRFLILSYHQARPEEGGAGAWILFLKRRERL